MGHRGSVAYLRPDGSVQSHYTHWGALEARLAFGDLAITEDTPFGTDSPTPDFADRLIGALESAKEVEAINLGSPDGDVDPDPDGIYDSLHDWAVNGLNFLHHEAAYVVDTTGEEWSVRAFDTVWHKGEDSLDGPDTGILVELKAADEWGDYAHASPEEDDAPDNNNPDRQQWVADYLQWLGSEASRVPVFSPLPTDNRQEDSP